jgi:hypothetical protein
MLERFAEYFYNPSVFWSAPLFITVVISAWHRLFNQHPTGVSENDKAHDDP